MARRVFVSALAGAVVLVAWTFAVNVGVGFAARVEMQPVPNEPAVYALLKAHVSKPGAYLANPPLTAGGEFPAGEPVFGIRLSGLGHEAAGRLLVFELAGALMASVLVAVLLSLTSTRVLSRYAYRVLYVMTIGLLLAVSGDLAKYGIGGYPSDAAMLLAANRVLSWALAGAVMAWTMRTRGEAGHAAQGL